MFNIIIVDPSFSGAFASDPRDVNRVIGPFQSREDAAAFLAKEGFGDQESRFKLNWPEVWTRGIQRLNFGGRPEDDVDAYVHAAHIVEMAPSSEGFRPAPPWTETEDSDPNDADDWAEETYSNAVHGPCGRP